LLEIHGVFRRACAAGASEGGLIIEIRLPHGKRALRAGLCEARVKLPDFGPLKADTSGRIGAL
jgi:hypothetical protein